MSFTPSPNEGIPNYSAYTTNCFGAGPSVFVRYCVILSKATEFEESDLAICTLPEGFRPASEATVYRAATCVRSDGLAQPADYVALTVGADGVIRANMSGRKGVSMIAIPMFSFTRA